MERDTEVIEWDWNKQWAEEAGSGDPVRHNVEKESS